MPRATTSEAIYAGVPPGRGTDAAVPCRRATSRTLCRSHPHSQETGHAAPRENSASPRAHGGVRSKHGSLRSRLFRPRDGAPL